MGQLKNRMRVRGITARSVSASLLAMVFIGSAINFLGAIAGFGGGYGTEALAITAIWVIVPLSLVSALIFRAIRWRPFTRPELFCILFSALLASPLIAQGFWTLMLGRLSTIPRSSDFAKLDAYPEKLWPHGPNLGAGKLEFSPGRDLLAEGGFEWEEVEYDEGRRALHPTVSNSETDERSSFLIPIEFAGEGEGLVPGKPYLLGVLTQARNLGQEAFYFCRLYFDQERTASEEIFSSRAIGKKTILHKTGFHRMGAYGVNIPVASGRNFWIEFGLKGSGTVTFRDLQLMDVSAIEDAYKGRVTLTESDYSTLNERERLGQVARPDSIFSLKGLQFLLTGYIPLGDWANPLVAWGTFIFLVLGASFALALMMRSQWVDKERFLLPLARIPRALLGISEGPGRTLPRIWKNPIMWAGLGIGLCWCLLRAWSFYNPELPDLGIRINLASYISDPRFGDMFSNVVFTVSVLVLGLALLMDLHILMSLFIGYWFFRSQYWFGEVFGFNAIPDFPSERPQVAGAYVAYALVIVVFTRKYLWGVLKEAIRGTNESGEILSHRISLLLFCGFTIGVIPWSRWVGIPTAGGLLIFLMLVSFGFVATKLRAECGIPMLGYFPVRFIYLIPFLGGIGVLGTGGAVFTMILAYTIGTFVFLVLPGIQFEMIQIGRELRMRGGHIVGTALLGIFGGILIGGAIYLGACYGRGVENFGNLGAFDPEIEVFGNFVNWHTAASERYFETGNQVAVEDFLNPMGGAMLFAGAITALTAFLRQIFAQFWFHPIGIILGPSEMMITAWGSIIAAWLIRFMVLKLGGAAAVREKLFPFAIGLFLGSVVANGLILAFNVWLFLYRPGLPGLPEYY